MMNGCKLCDISHKKPWFETKLDWCWCVECATAGPGTAVFIHRAHVTGFTALEKDAVIFEAKRLFGEDVRLEWQMDEKYNHAYMHVIFNGGTDAD